MVTTWNCLIFVCICHHRFSRMKVRHNSDHLRSSITSPSWSQVTSKFCRKLTNYPITQTHWGALLVNNRAGLRCWIKGANHNFVMIPAHHEHYTHPAQQRCWSRASDLKQVQGFHHFSKLPGGVHEQMLTVRLNNFRFSLIFTDFAVVVQLPAWANHSPDFPRSQSMGHQRTDSHLEAKSQFSSQSFDNSTGKTHNLDNLTGA